MIYILTIVIVAIKTILDLDYIFLNFCLIYETKKQITEDIKMN